MRRSEWEALVRRLRQRADVAALARERAGAHAYETLLAVYLQAYTRQMARTAYLARQHGARLVARFDAGESLLDVAEWLNLAPCMVARRVLELKLGASRQRVTRLLREPALIEDERLREEVVLCVDSDEHAGPRTDRLRTVMGLEYEFRLIDMVKNLGLQFETENDLRARGCHKTPDVLLRVPVAFAGSVVRWIDSKAKFGDEYFMNKDYTDSVSSYVGRFGPGMVLYWFGFVEDCDTPMLKDAGVVVVDKLPDDIVMLPGSTLQELHVDHRPPVVSASSAPVQAPVATDAK